MGTIKEKKLFFFKIYTTHCTTIVLFHVSYVGISEMVTLENMAL